LSTCAEFEANAQVDDGMIYVQLHLHCHGVVGKMIEGISSEIPAGIRGVKK